MELTENNMKTKAGMIPSLLKASAMFKLSLIGDKENLDFIAIRCINCKTKTAIYLQNSVFEEMITTSVLYTILHHVGMSWIISSNNEMKYEIEKVIIKLD